MMDETLKRPVSISHGDFVYRDRNQKIQHVVAEFDGFQKEYFVSDHGMRSAVIVESGGQILLTRQYRLLIDDLSHEIPGGGIDPGESPETAAMRECEEETGIRCRNLKPLIEFYPSLDIWKNYTFVFSASEFETISVPESCTWISLDQCLDMISRGTICDSLSILAILRFKLLTSQE